MTISSFSISVKVCFLLFFISTKINAKYIRAASTSFYHVKLAVDSASPGDKVLIPSGISNWGTNTLHVPGGISLIGSGSNKTIIKRNQLTSDYLIRFDGSNELSNELHHIGFEGFFVNNPTSAHLNSKNYSNGVGFINGAVNFVVSGCKFSKFANTAITVGHSERQKGIIFSNEFINNYYASIQNFGYGVAVYGGNTWPQLELGTENAVFIEDNVFLGNRHHVASNGGSRYVFRYNDVTHTDVTKNYAMTDAHGKSLSSSFGSRSYEIYNNNYKTKNVSSLVYAAIGIRGGDGVIFNNTIDSKIVHSVVLSIEGFSCGVYPGVNQTRSLHIWDNENKNNSFQWANIKNGIQNTCNSSIRENRDYFTYKDPNYRPYPYPHPRRNNIYE